MFYFPDSFTNPHQLRSATFELIEEFKQLVGQVEKHQLPHPDVKTLYEQNLQPRAIELGMELARYAPERTLTDPLTSGVLFSDINTLQAHLPSQNDALAILRGVTRTLEELVKHVPPQASA